MIFYDFPGFCSINTYVFVNIRSQPGFCTKLTVEALEQGVEYVQSHQNEANGVILVFLLLTLNICRTLI